MRGPRRPQRISAIQRRGAARLLAFGMIAACAQPGMPPGGPPDDAPPVLLAISPESGSVNVSARAILLRFDEVVNERSTVLTSASGSGGGFAASTGAPGLASLVVLSPSDGRDRVIWRRHAIEIEPRGGLRANTAYRVTLLPGLADLRGNRRTTAHEFVFATGATIATGEINGVFFDWAGARATPAARVEVWREADSTFRWIARSDSTGRFVLRDLENGRYRLRGWMDADNDRRVGAREIHDEVAVELTDRAEADLYAFEHDTIGPRIETVELVDSTAIRIRFDRAVAVGFIPDRSAITLYGSDSAQIPLDAAIPATRFDSLRRAATAARDTAARDTTARDTLATARPVVPPVPPLGGLALTDTTPRLVLPLPQRPIPAQIWVAPLASPLSPGEYRVKARDLPGLTGASRPSERVFTIRPPPAPRDTAAAGDSAATRPPNPPPNRPPDDPAGRPR